MEFKQFEPIYEAIVADLDLERSADERARSVLASLTGPFDLDRLAAASGATVAIAGAGPSLDSPDSLERIRDCDLVFAASTAVDRLADHEIDIDCMVTDLDKNPDTVIELTGCETPVAVHAHGDNIPAVREIVPDCTDEFVLPTTQVAPFGPVRNFGGFTDGDRAAFLADVLGADRLIFCGWDLDDPTVDPMKAAKLEWAERLLFVLERRRGQQFDVLDGRRDEIDLSVLPAEYR